MPRPHPRLIEALESRIVLGSAAADALTPLLIKLGEFASQKTTSFAAPGVPPPYTLITAKADDVVFAVYQLAMTASFDDAAEISILVKTALQARAQSGSTVLKVRADKDKIAPRILNAALLGSGLANDASAVSDITSALATVNGGQSRLELTVAGKEALIGQALKSTSSSSASVGQAIADVAKTLSSAVPGTTPEGKLQTFAIAAIKAAGVGTGEVRSFTGKLLVSGVSPGNQQAFALKVAEGVTKIPTSAGEVIGGAAAQLNSSATIESLALAALSDTKLKSAIAAIVAGTASAIPVGSESDFAKTLVTALGTKATTAVRASIASGAIQAINQTASLVTVSDVITKVLEPGSPGPKVLTKAELATFAGGAAVGTGDSADDVVTKISLLASTQFTPATGYNATTLTSVGVAVLKAIASTSPSSGKQVAQALIDSTTLFSDLPTLARNLAKAVPTNGPVTGAAVAGVATKLNGGNPTDDQLATLGGAVIPVASKATLNISKELSALLTTTNFKEFATLMVGKAGITTATAPNVAAGVAVTAALAGLDPSLNQTPGDIAVAVATATDSKGVLSYQPKLATIAGAVALAVDVERIAGVGAKVAALYQNAGSVSTLPKLTSIGTLATSLAKAINTKPLTTTGSRVDELGELAAELTRAAITKLRVNASAQLLASTISTIGTSVVKGLSNALLINGGAFAADLKDSARDIAGAIAQTISHIGKDNTVISDSNVEELLKDTGTLAKGLAKAVKTLASEVNGNMTSANSLGGAFGEVRFAKTNKIDRLVSGGEPLGFGERPLDGTSDTFGKYEVGSLIDPQTSPASLP